MRILALLACVAAIMAGCTGLPAGSADVGDEVTASFLAVDPATGYPIGSRLDLAGPFEQGGETVYVTSGLRQLMTQTLGAPLPAGIEALFSDDEGNPVATVPRDAVLKAVHDAGLSQEFAFTFRFVVGDGESGWPVRVENALVGHVVNETFHLACGTADESCTKEARAGATLGPFEIRQTAPRADFEAAVGTPEVGTEFPLNNLYDGLVVNVTDTDVVYEVQAVTGQQDPVAQVGAIIVTQVSGATYEWVLEPDVGTTFIVRPPSQFNQQTPLGLEPGAYQTVGKEGDELVYAFLPISSTAPFDGAYELQITITDVVQTPDEVPQDQFGKRDSPVLRGEPSTDDDHAHGEADDHADDGHEH